MVQCIKKRGHGTYVAPPTRDGDRRIELAQRLEDERARTKLRVRSAPNSAVALSSSARALRIDSSVDTSSSCESSSSTSIGSAIKLPVSFGLMSRASAVIEAVCLVRLRRE